MPVPAQHIHTYSIMSKYDNDTKQHFAFVLCVKPLTICLADNYLTGCYIQYLSDQCPTAPCLAVTFPHAPLCSGPPFLPAYI